MHHPGCPLILEKDVQLGKKELLIFKTTFMKKKILFCAMLGISVMAFARVQAVWTSTCGVTHYTTFTGNWTYNQMALYIAQINQGECGVTPNVTINP